MRRRALLAGLGVLSAGCLSLFQPASDPDVAVSNSADSPVEYTIEVRTESSDLVFSDTTTIEPGEEIYYTDVLGAERYEVTVIFDDGTWERYEWDRVEGTTLWVDLRGGDVVFDSDGTA
jgi:hypothetical protein